MNAEQNIEKLKIKLPEAKAPVGNYVATKISGKILQKIQRAFKKRSGLKKIKKLIKLNKRFQKNEL